MQLKKLQLETAKFATIDGNRDVDVKKLKKVIMKSGRVLVPILVIRYQVIHDKEIVLYDLRTGERIENPSDDYYVVMDGQHRCISALQLYQEMQTEGSEVKIKDFIYANVYEDEDLLDKQDESTYDENAHNENTYGENTRQSIMSLIMIINSSTRSWANKDYIKSAYTHNPEDETVSTVNLLAKLGFSISNISRLLCSNHKTLNAQVLSRYISGENELPECNPRKALEILRMLLGIGFTIDFLKKRYLADEIVIKHNAYRLDGFLNSLCRLDPSTVKSIESLSPQDLDNHKIRDIIHNYDKSLNEDEQTKCFTTNLSEETFLENIDMLKKLAEELKTAKKLKGNRKGGTPAKKNEADIKDCITFEVK